MYCRNVFEAREQMLQAVAAVSGSSPLVWAPIPEAQGGLRYPVHNPTTEASQNGIWHLGLHQFALFSKYIAELWKLLPMPT